LKVETLLKRNLAKAKKRLAKESADFDRVRQRRDYWSRTVDSLSNRLDDLKSGQTELPL